MESAALWNFNVPAPNWIDLDPAVNFLVSLDTLLLTTTVSRVKDLLLYCSLGRIINLNPQRTHDEPPSGNCLSIVRSLGERSCLWWTMVTILLVYSLGNFNKVINNNLQTCSCSNICSSRYGNVEACRGLVRFVILILRSSFYTRVLFTNIHPPQVRYRTS